MGKKVGIIALVCAILYIIFSIIWVIEAPKIPNEVYELVLTDMEEYYERVEEIYENTSTLFNVSSIATTILGWAGIILSIVSIVKIAKAKEKGIIIPIISLATIIITYIIATFLGSGGTEAFQAGLSKGMEMRN